MKYTKQFGKFALAGIALLAAFQSQAAVFEIKQEINGGLVATVATLEVIQTGDDASFTLTGNFDALSENSFIKEIFFTGDNGEFQAVSGNTILGAPQTTYSAGMEYSGETFDWRVRFPVGRSADRFLSSDTATWKILGADADSFSNPLIKLNGATGGIVKVTAISAVPEADTFALLVAGLSLMGVTLRRRIG
jgi:hypothetical protein